MSVVRHITPALFIRQHLLRMTTVKFADLLGVSKAVISRYEISGVIPPHHHKAILREASKRNVKIKPSWFQAVPWAAGVPE